MKRYMAVALMSLGLFGPGSPVWAKSPSPSPSAAAKAAQIDLNSADEASLRTLPGIGPVHAKKIITSRPYKSKDQLVSKKVLSQSQYDKIKDRVIAKQK